MNKILFLLNKVVKKLWVRCCAFCLLAVFAIICGPELGPYIPNKLKAIVSPDTVEDILKILASSMLAVTTFSLSIMVQAFSTAATTASPRSNALLMQNSTAQNALGAFIGAFLFSIVGIISIGANVYQEDIVIVLFLFTIIVIAVVVILLLKWIDQLSRLGRVSETISTVEKALHKSIVSRAKHPYLCANPMKNASDRKRYPIICSTVGYVQYIDVEAMNKIAKKKDVCIFISVNPGKFMNSLTPLVETSSELDESTKKDIVDTIVVGDNRTFEQDPRYGFVVLNEIALKSLSPAINDPGTAIDVIGSFIRAMRVWVDSFPSEEQQYDSEEVKFGNVYIEPISERDVLEDIYSALIPAVSQTLHVSQHLKKSFITIEKIGSETLAQAAREWRDCFYDHCQSRLSEAECTRLKSDG